MLQTFRVISQMTFFIDFTHAFHLTCFNRKFYFSHFLLKHFKTGEKDMFKFPRHTLINSSDTQRAIKTNIF